MIYKPKLLAFAYHIFSNKHTVRSSQSMSRVDCFKADSDHVDYLKATDYLDVNNSYLVTLSKNITENLPDDRSKAIAIHDYVRDQILFGFSSSFWNQIASEVLVEKKGFCNTKTTLFVAMLRSVGIPAKQIFVDINSKILDGYLDTRSDFVDHSYAEVKIDDIWVKTDSFILDKTLFESAQEKLKIENKKIGYGTLVGACNTWDGKSDSFSQFLPNLYNGLSTKYHGEFDDIGSFYSTCKLSINGSWFNRFIFKFIASDANSRIQKVRSNKSSE